MNCLPRLKSMVCYGIGMLLIACFAGVMAHADGRRIERRIAPVYPEIARQANVVGVVKITVMVAADGSVTQAKATDGNPLLAGAAVDAVRKWRFEPADAPSTEKVQVIFIGAE